MEDYAILYYFQAPDDQAAATFAAVTHGAGGELLKMTESGTLEAVETEGEEPGK